MATTEATVGENGSVSGRRVTAEREHPPAERVLGDRYLRDLYTAAYGALSQIVDSAPVGPVIEIGAGTGIARRLGHRWWLSDVGSEPGVDIRCDARLLPLADASISALVLKDSLHHIAEVDRFLDEADRVLTPGGVIAVFEPFWGPLARFVYRYLHQEPFDDVIASWSFPADSPWESNQALSFMMVVRDQVRLQTLWPRFVLERGAPLVGPSFLFSGGVSRRTPVSGRLLAAMLRWEERRQTWFDTFRFFHVFALRKVLHT